MKMTSQRSNLPLAALALSTCLYWSAALPLSDNNDRDGRLFYAYNERGDMITKQMTMQEIQALIAGGGPDRSSVETHEPQKADDILTGGKKVIDVVEKVQSVLKSALDKKPSTLTGSVSTIPEQANAEWSNILPAILAAGDKVDELVDVEQITRPAATGTFANDSYQVNAVQDIPPNSSESTNITHSSNASTVESFGQRVETFETTIASSLAAIYTEKPMIPVPVITTEEREHVLRQTTQSSVFEKITHLVFSASVSDNGPNDHSKKPSIASPSASSSSIVSVTPSVSNVPSGITNNGYTNAELNSWNSNVVTKQHSTTFEEFVASSERTDATSSISIGDSSSQSDGGQLWATSTIPSATFTKNEDKLSTLPTISTYIESSTYPTSPGTGNNLVAKPNDLETVHSPEPLSTELVNSLSSMINQISGAVSSVLPVTSEFEVVKSPIDSAIDSSGEKMKQKEQEEEGEDGEAEEEEEQRVHELIDHMDTYTTASPTNVTSISFVKDVDSTVFAIRQEEYENVEAEPGSRITEHSTEQSLTDVGQSETTPQIWSTFEPMHREGSTKVSYATQSSSETTETGATNINAIDVTGTLATNSIFSAKPHFTNSSPPSDSSAMELSLTYNTQNFDSSSDIPDLRTRSNMSASATIENILKTISTEAPNVITEALVLPNISAVSGNFPTKTLASALIAGFQTTSVQDSSINDAATVSLYSSSILPQLEDASPNPDDEQPQTMTNLESNGTSKPQSMIPVEDHASNSTIAEELHTADGNKTLVSQTILTEYPSLLPIQIERTTQRTTSEPRTTVENRDAAKPTEDIVLTTHLSTFGGTVSLADVPTRSTWVDATTPSDGDQFDKAEINVGTATNTESTQVTVNEVTFSPDVVLPEELAPAKKEDPALTVKPDENTSAMPNVTGASFTSTTITDDDNGTAASANGTVIDRGAFTEPSVHVLSTRFEQPHITSERTEVYGYAMNQQLNRTNSLNASDIEDLPSQNRHSIETVLVTPSVPPFFDASNDDRPIATTSNLASNDLSNSKSGLDGAPVENLPSKKLKPEILATKKNNTEADGKWELISLHQAVPSWPEKVIGSSKQPVSTARPVLTLLDKSQEATKFTGYRTTGAAAATETAMATPTSTTGHTSTPSQLVHRYSSSAESASVPLNASKSTGGLDVSSKNTSVDIVNFSRFCNELAFEFWAATNKGLSTARSLALSPFGMISLLAMIFLGARGPTSDQMNEVLGLDNVATFNPHLIFQNVTDAVSLARQQGIANAAFVRELFADKAKVRKLMPFYKEQAQQFYEGLVAEVNFATISDLARRRTNLLIRKQTGGRIKDFVRSNAVPLRSPLAAISANVFQTDCNSSMASAVGRDGELYFAVSPALRLRRLIPVPATVWRSNLLAGYEPSLDATVVALGGVGKLVSTIFLLPGQQGHVAPGDTLDRLEQRLVKGAFRDGYWDKLLQVLVPRPGLELQVPKFSHRSVVNATAALKRMGLDQLFSGRADFKGINGVGNRLFLSDVLQMNLFSTCGDENIVNGRHHVETYPATSSSRNSRLSTVEKFVERETDEEVDSKKSREWNGLSSLESRRSFLLPRSTKGSEKTEEKPRLKLDQPFLYFVRHNPTGLILHMGRFNPKLST